MKTKTWFTIIAASLLGGWATQGIHAQDIDASPPVVVKAVPEAGSKNVPPGEYEIKVTFSKDMLDESWSWSTAWKDSTPELVGKPRYAADHRTCVCKVKLEPGKTYGWWLNSQNFHNFKDAQGHAAVPYLLTFQTASKALAETPTGQKLLAPIPSANELPGTLTFHGHYKHRSRGGDIEQPSELWLKETAGGGVTALAQLPFSNSIELADGKQHRLEQSAAGERSGYQIDLELGNGQARLNRRGVRQDCDGKELKVPENAWFDPNTRPDSYCAANVLLRAFAVGENETKEFRAYDWDNTGNALVDYTIRVKNAGKERVEVPAGIFQANHLVLTQVTSANTWFKKSAGHVTDFWVLDNHVIVRILRHREPYELVLLDYDVPAKLPGLDKAGTLK